jgi:GNAT superfamily N-acetyltransferase
MTLPVAIRKVQPGDRSQWERLWRGYQAFYQVDLPSEVTETTWRRFFDENEPVHALVAARGTHLVGLVHFIFHRSTWLIGPTCYLQDLFTHESERGSGIGRALIEAVYADARAEGAGRVYWLTQATNTTAMRLYDQVAQRSGFVQYRKIL